MTPWWATVLSVAAGGVFAILGQWLQVTASSRSERRARADERRAVALERRHAYELEQLAELRASSHALMDEIVEAQEGLYGEPLGNYFLPELAEPCTRLRRSIYGVIDPAVADAAEGFLTSGEAAITFAEGGAVEEAAAQLTRAEAAIGSRIREIYGPDPHSGDHEEGK